MVKRMLIDATHSEETRVAVITGNRLDEFDFETSTKKQLKGNIYLAKVIRVEPSLQAAFVDYGGNRHGFLAFSEIHPDYYRIPIADREALLAAEAAKASDDLAADPDDVNGGEESPDAEIPDAETPDAETPDAEADAADAEAPEDGGQAEGADAAAAEAEPSDDEDGRHGRRRRPRGAGVEVVGGDEVDEMAARHRVIARNYRIQEVISRRQILLVQVVKEERGTKGAALTTYISLAGRCCVLMPNTPRGGGISRKITEPADRKRLKGILTDLNIPPGMAVILRTAGMERSKPEIKRDYEYLVRLWDGIRERTLESSAPALIHEEADLIKRSIRDLYSRDIDEIHIEGEEGYRAAKDFMRMLIPSHARRVHRYKAEGAIPLFHRYQVENQVDDMHSPVVHLKSGGYIVIDATEALVAVDVNSGRATRERNIEETARRTNLEAAEEVARQLRLRDLAGLIVIDFIDMDDSRNRHRVEKRLKEAMKGDRARIQLGRISAFGLLELSRQRLRPSLIEASMRRCPHCGGSGHIRSTESTTLHVLRAIEEEGMRRRSREISLFVPTEVALYVLNHKRAALAEIESRYDFRVSINADDSLVPPDMRLERLGGKSGDDERAPRRTEAGAGDGSGDGRRRPRRRRVGKESAEDLAATAATADAAERQSDADADAAESGEEATPARKPRRRGKRGGRRRSRQSAAAAAPADTIEGTGGTESAAPETVAQASQATEGAAPETVAQISQASVVGADAATDDDTKEEPKKATAKAARPTRRRRARPAAKPKKSMADEPSAEEPAGETPVKKSHYDAGKSESPKPIKAIDGPTTPAGGNGDDSGAGRREIAETPAAESVAPPVPSGGAGRDAAAAPEPDQAEPGGRRGWWTRILEP